MDFREFCYLSVSIKCVEKIRVSLNITKIEGTLPDDLGTCMISPSVLIRTTTGVVEKMKC